MNNEFLNKKLNRLLNNKTKILTASRNFSKGQIVTENYIATQDTRKGTTLLLTEGGQAIPVDAEIDSGRVVSSRTVLSRHGSLQPRQRPALLVGGAVIYTLVTEEEKVEFWLKTGSFNKKITEIDEYLIEESDDSFPFAINPSIYNEVNPSLGNCRTSLLANWRLAYPPGPGDWRFIVSVAGAGAIGATTVFVPETGDPTVTSVPGVVDSRLPTFGTSGLGQGGGSIDPARWVGAYRNTDSGISSELRDRNFCIRRMLKSSSFAGAGSPIFGWFPETQDSFTNPYELCDPRRRPVITPLPAPESGEGTYKYKNRYEVFLYKYARDNYFVSIKDSYNWRDTIFDRVQYFFISKDTIRLLDTEEDSLGWRSEALGNQPAYTAENDKSCIQDYLPNPDSYLFNREKFLFKINRDEELHKIESVFISNIEIEEEPNPELTEALEIPFDDIYCNPQASSQFNPQDLTDPLIYTTLLTVDLPENIDTSKLLNKGIIKVTSNSRTFQYSEGFDFLGLNTKIKIRIKGRIFRQNEGDPNFYYRNSTDITPISLPLPINLIYTVENWLATKEDNLPVIVSKMQLKSEETECLLREKKTFDLELPSPGKGKIEVVLAYKK